MKEKEKQEEELRLMAQRTREERAGIRPPKEAEVRWLWLFLLWHFAVV